MSEESLPASKPNASVPPHEHYPTVQSRERDSRQAQKRAGDFRVRVVAALRHHEWLVLAVVVAGSTLGVLLTRMLPKQYAVTATIWLGSKGGTRLVKNDAPGQASQSEQHTSWPEAVRAPTILDSVVLEQRLYVEPARAADSKLLDNLQASGTVRPGTYEYQLDETGGHYVLTWNNEEVEEGAAGDSVGRAAGFAWLPPGGALPSRAILRFFIVDTREARSLLASTLHVTLSQGGSFLRVALTSETPQRAARTVNAVARRVVSMAADLRARTLVEYDRVLESSLSQAQRGLDSAASALKKLERINSAAITSAHGAAAAETQDPIVKEYLDRRLEYENARQNREALQHALEDVKSRRADLGELQSLAMRQEMSGDLENAVDELVRKQVQLRAAEHTYSADHPLVSDLRQQVSVLQDQTIPALMSSAAERMRDREADVEARMKDAMREVHDVPTRTVEEMWLRREMAVNENRYAQLKSWYEETRRVEASALPEVKVLDSAVAPKHPAADYGPLLTLLAFVGSIGVAIGAALLIDRTGKRIRYPDQVLSELGLRILGTVQTMRKTRTGTTDPVVAARVVEAFQSIRLRVTESFAPDAQVILVISSAGEGEGKSLVAANLSLCFAEANMRTLLMDGDIRHGQLHALFEVERQPGLMDALVDGTPLKESLRATSHPYLTLMTSGSRRQSGPEYLESDALMDLVSSLWPPYDVVIVDAAPLNAGSDAFALATLAGNMLFVVRLGTTDRRLAASKLESLDSFPVRLLGTVLNDVHSEQREYTLHLYPERGASPHRDRDKRPLQILGVNASGSRRAGTP